VESAVARSGVAGGDILADEPDCTVYRESGIDRQLAGRPVIADGGCYGVAEVIVPFRKPVRGRYRQNAG
jgi:hypothetical protein